MSPAKLASNSQYRSKHFCAGPSNSYEPATVSAWDFSQPGNCLIAPAFPPEPKPQPYFAEDRCSRDFPIRRYLLPAGCRFLHPSMRPAAHRVAIFALFVSRVLLRSTKCGLVASSQLHHGSRACHTTAGFTSPVKSPGSQLALLRTRSGLSSVFRGLEVRTRGACRGLHQQSVNGVSGAFWSDTACRTPPLPSLHQHQPSTHGPHRKTLSTQHAWTAPKDPTCASLLKGHTPPPRKPHQRPTVTPPRANVFPL